MKRKVTGKFPEWCNYDQIYKITWVIDGRSTNNFSTRGKRIKKTVAPQQKKLELGEAVVRLEVGKKYLTGSITRQEAVKELQSLQFLCPKNPTAHLLTLAEFSLDLR